MLVSILALAFVLQVSGPAASETGVEAEVGAVIDRLHAAASVADGETYFSLFTPDARFLGTDVAERWSVEAFRAYAEPYFSRGQGWTYVSREREVTIAPVACRCVAWFDEVLDSQSYGTARGSGVLIQTPEGWRVSQYVLSFPIPNDIVDDVIDRIKAFEAAGAPLVP